MPLGYYHPAYGATPAGVGQNFATKARGGGGRASSGAGSKTLTQRVAEIVGYKVTARDGTTYEVVTAGGQVAIRIKPPGASVVITSKPASSDWARVATTVLSLKRSGGGVFQKAGAAKGPGGKASSKKSSTTTTTTTTTTSDTTGTTTQAPTWASALYLAEMMALVGQTIPSNFYAGMTFTIKTTTLDGLDAPMITVTPASGTATDITPNTSQWMDTASQVLAAVSAAAASGGASSGGAGGGGGGATVVTEEITPAVADQALADEAVETVDAAITDAMTVSGEGAKATGEEGFISKYKWWLLGAAAIAAYTQREAIMRLVKR